MPDGDPATHPSAERIPAGSPDGRFGRLHLWQFQWVRDLIVIASVVGLVWLGYALRSVTVPLLIGLLLAYLFEPLVRWLERFRWCPRPLAALWILAVAGVTIVAALVVAIPLLVGQAASLVESFRSGRMESRIVTLVERAPDRYRDDLRRGASWIFGSAHELDPGDEPAVRADGERELDAAAAPKQSVVGPSPEGPVAERPVASEFAAEPAGSEVAAAPRSWAWLGVAGTGLRTIWQTVLGALSLLLAVVLIPFYFYYFSVGFPALLEALRELIPQSNRPRVVELARKMDAAVAGFVRGRIVISVLMGLGFAVGWLLVGVPYAILLGLLTGLLCAVPYLGVVGLPAAIVVLAIEQAGVPAEARMGWFGVLFWPSLVYSIVQLVESYILTPVIAGKATDLSPLAIFVAVLAGGALAGIYGMLLSIPVAACLKILAVEVLLPRIRAWTRGEVSDPLPVGGDG
jgi:predicted PurR-regulated permease PerM